MAIKNLWGEIDNLPQIKPPVSILKEQSQMLEKMTKGLLVGKIVSNSKDNEFEYTFYINAPSLNNYTYPILMIYHEITLYPVTIEILHKKERMIECKDIEEFEAKLGNIFSSPEIRKVISGLLSQIQSA